MIQRNRKLLHVLNATIDYIIAFTSYLLCEDVFAQILIRLRGPEGKLYLGSQGELFWPMLTAMLIVLLLGLFGMYNSLRTRRVRKEYRFILQTNTIVVIVVSVLFLLITGQGLSRGLLLLYFCVVTLLLGIKRYLMHAVFGYMRSTGMNLKHVIVLGSGPLAQQYAAGLEENRFFGFVIDGYFGDSPERDFARYLGSLEDCEKQLENLFVDEIVVALDPEDACRLNALINICESSGIKTSVIPSFTNLIPSNPAITIIGDMKLVQLRCNQLDNFGYAFLKRMMDIVISALLIILLSPLLPLIALGIKMSSPGPVLFKQIRVGKDRREFLLLKFRSMRMNEGEETSWTTDDDNRKTKVGTFLRKFSLDELPQLLNVIRGDMSLIGPRPEIPFYVKEFKKTVPKYMVKHQIRPGITGLAQVNGYRGDTDITRRIYYDIWYIENWTFLLDIKILFQTIFGGWINHEKPAKKAGGK